MKTYDVIVIGSGSGMTVVDGALNHGLSVALVDHGPLGGTCLNIGCIPSKLLIYPADRVVEIQEAQKLGISAQITDIDFAGIMNRMRQSISESQHHMRLGIGHIPLLDYYETTGQFIDDYTLTVGNDTIRGNKIFIASGARPIIPPLSGLETCTYLTNENIFQLKKKPESLVIIGGGYIAAEFGHFFASMGTKVTIFQRGSRMLTAEEPEISELLMKKLGERCTIYTNTEAIEVQCHKKGYTVLGKKQDGALVEVTSEQFMVAAGRQSNADRLQVEKTGVTVDNHGFIKANEYLETTKKNIWAWGDVIGKAMFRHSANNESELAWRNAVHKQKIKMDYRVIPHAVFSSPQIAGVGLTQELAAQNYDILVGTARYTDVAKGEAMQEFDGFAKAIVERNSGKILGFHIIGPYAPILIQEVIDIMALNGGVTHIAQGMHIHPALPELIMATLGRLQETTKNSE
ncbi:MAG: dihydrolipoyl dehydrogenase [Candidatus Thermoplasmatota archaeon]|nr:dihydrolipoyl dehydrogenase [Candidatus Thermoplasmatota archaeon]MBU1941097.1 dihydrolipoyl dehydrogenase [Candidatus Thermoplasmatota archaeon]